MNRSWLLVLLQECNGNDIWSFDECHRQGVPNAWVKELRDIYESGFQSNTQTIYYKGKITNQFEGVRDVDLACKIATELGLNLRGILEFAVSRADCVHRIKEALEED